MKKTMMTFALVLAAGTAFALSPASPQAAAGPTSGVRPIALQTYADAYDLNLAAHYLVGTADPDPTLPQGTCISSPLCGAAGQLTIGRGAYLGSFLGAPNGNGIVSILVFDASQIDAKAKGYNLHLENLQNFTGQAHRIYATVARNTGATPGARGAFANLGPFGVPTAGSLQTIIVEGRGQSESAGSQAVAGRGLLIPHGAYLTFDRTLDIDLGDIGGAVAAAQAAGESYTSCRYSCAGPLVRNVDCTLPINNPLYVYLYSVRADGNSDRRIQSGLAVDNILHVMGDCDFDDGAAPGDVSFAELQF